jgi:UDP-N-acetylglucosamine acyltransferase
MSDIHPTAIIEDGAVIGEGVRIGAYAVVEGKARIGDGCVLDSHAIVKDYVTLGARCHVHACAVLGDWPQDHAFANEPSFVETGTDCDFREGVTVHRGTKPGTTTRIGNHVMMMANSHAAHNVQMGDGVILANGAMLAGYVEVGDHAFISGNVLVHQFVRIGRLVMMGGGSAVAFDVLPYCLTMPVSGNLIGGLNLVGMKRAGMGPADRKAVKDAYRIMFRSGLNTAQGIAKIRELFADGPAREMAEFAAASKRGISTAHVVPKADDGAEG